MFKEYTINNAKVQAVRLTKKVLKKNHARSFYSPEINSKVSKVDIFKDVAYLEPLSYPPCLRIPLKEGDVVLKTPLGDFYYMPGVAFDEIVGKED